MGADGATATLQPHPPQRSTTGFQRNGSVVSSWLSDIVNTTLSMRFSEDVSPTLFLQRWGGLSITGRVGGGKNIILGECRVNSHTVYLADWEVSFKGLERGKNDQLHSYSK